MGEVFAGRYELLDLIGEGGMGTIWVALDRKTDGLVAAKVLRQSDAGTLLRFVREQSVRIHDPNVLTPLGWAGEDDRVLFTMPIIRGGSVATLVGDHGPLPPHLVAELLRQTLSGLAAVHAADIVHRDIKPANILLDATGTGRPRAYVSDFGIAVDINAPRWTETGFISGTPGYLAPELESFGTLSPATDLYAVGQVALTMLTSQGPAERVGSGRPVGCPESLWSVVSALVAPDPVDRPESARAALEALSVPELDWRPDAMGEVEIFDQVVSDGPEVTRPKVHRRTPPGPQVFDAAEQPRHSGTTPGPARRGGLEQPRHSGTTPGGVERRGSGSANVPGWLVPSSIAGLALIGGLLIWSPWDTQGGGADNAPSPSASASASTSATTTPIPATTPTVASPSPSTVPTPSPSQGSVTVGRVVLSVGQPCEFVEVGAREKTVDGTAVTCQLQPNGTYAWVAP